MIEDKLDKATKNFSSLPEDKQDYILGILQALVFAYKEENFESVPVDETGTKTTASLCSSLTK